jgi:DNA-directed RNA polymerase specialized sigma24 family protein
MGVEAVTKALLRTTERLLSYRYPSCSYLDCEEAVAEACLHFLRMPLPPHVPLEAGLFQVARTKLIDLQRKHRRQQGWTRRGSGWHFCPPTWYYTARQDDHTRPARAVEARHDAQAILHLLKPSQQRRIIAISEEDTYKQAAYRLGCSVGALKAGVYAMRQGLQKARHPNALAKGD